MKKNQPVHPKRWKVALLIWLFIFPFISLIPFLLQPIFTLLSSWQRPLVISLILVPIMVYFYLPFLHKRFFQWLQK